MKVKIKNILLGLFANKITFVVLCVVLIFITFFVKNSILVKGDNTKNYSVVVYDGSSKQILSSTTFNVSDVLSQNNIRTYPEDIVTTELITDPVVDGGSGEKIVIKRSPHFFVDVDGAVKEVRSWSPLVSDIIKKTETNLGVKDQISPALGASLLPGETVTVTRVREADVDVLESVDFETIEKGDSSIPFGQKKTTQEGIAGKIKKTYHVTYKNGLENSRYLLSKEIVVQKQNRIISSGTITGRANFGYYDGMVTSFYRGMTGRYLLVTNLANGKQVRVKIIGSGPFNGPIMDMGTEPFKAIGGSLADGYLPSVSVQLVD